MGHFEGWILLQVDQRIWVNAMEWVPKHTGRYHVDKDKINMPVNLPSLLSGNTDPNSSKELDANYDSS